MKRLIIAACVGMGLVYIGLVIEALVDEGEVQAATKTQLEAINEGLGLIQWESRRRNEIETNKKIKEVRQEKAKDIPRGETKEYEVYVEDSWPNLGPKFKFITEKGKPAMWSRRSKLYRTITIHGTKPNTEKRRPKPDPGRHIEVTKPQPQEVRPKPDPGRHIEVTKPQPQEVRPTYNKFGPYLTPSIDP